MDYPTYAIKIVKITSPSTERVVETFDFDIEWTKNHKPKKFKYLPTSAELKKAIKNDNISQAQEKRPGIRCSPLFCRPSPRNPSNRYNEIKRL